METPLDRHSLYIKSVNRELFPWLTAYSIYKFIWPPDTLIILGVTYLWNNIIQKSVYSSFYKLNCGMKFYEMNRRCHILKIPETT